MATQVDSSHAGSSGGCAAVGDQANQPSGQMPQLLQQKSPIQFYINGVLVEKDEVDLPATLEEFLDLARLLPNAERYSLKDLQVVAYLGEPDGPQDIRVLRDRIGIKGLWNKAVGSPRRRLVIRVYNLVKEQEEAKESRHFLNRCTWPVLGVVLATVCHFTSTMRPEAVSQIVATGRAVLGSSQLVGTKFDGANPKEQMTSFALANVQVAEHPESSFLDNMMMEDARSYHKSVAFQTQSSQKDPAVISALSNTNLPKDVVERIGALVDNTSVLEDQFSDFMFTKEGKAVYFSVNVWVSSTSEGTSHVALMVSGAEFKKSVVTGTQEVEEPLFEERRIDHPATWSQSGRTEYVRVPLTYDGKTQATRKLKKPVFDSAMVKPHEVDIMRKYLLTQASYDTLRNYAPARIPMLLKEQRMRWPRVASGSEDPRPVEDDQQPTP